MEIFDLAVIGGGPGGYLCAERAAAGKMSVVLFEENRLGGVCLNEGCIPTKALLYSAKLYRHAADSEEFGVTVTGVSYDHERAVSRKDNVIRSLVNGVASVMQKNNVRVVNAAARLDGKDGALFRVGANGETYLARRLCIATGSEPAVPPVTGLREALDRGFAVTNREILSAKTLPRSLAVIGGGVIGLEMAFYFSAVGVNVTVVEMLDKLAGNTDDDISRALLAACERRGMKIHLNSRVMEITEKSMVFEDAGGVQDLTPGLILLSAGRRARTSGIGLETIGVETEQGAVVTDRHMCTNIAGVYAVGDCNGRLMLAHTAYREAEAAARHMLGEYDEMRYDHIPSVIYTDPEAASVGMTKQAARDAGLQVREVSVPMQYSGRYLAETSGGSGFAKLVADMDTKRLLGVHIFGPYASEMILSAEQMLETELPVERLRKLVFPHPTVGEVLREGLFRL